MSSKRAVRRRACKGKVRFESLAAALRKKKFVRRDYGDLQQAYHCDFCGGWHLGHAPERSR